MKKLGPCYTLFTRRHQLLTLPFFCNLPLFNSWCASGICLGQQGPSTNNWSLCGLVENSHFWDGIVWVFQVWVFILALCSSKERKHELLGQNCLSFSLSEFSHFLSALDENFRGASWGSRCSSICLSLLPVKELQKLFSSSHEYWQVSLSVF